MATKKKKKKKKKPLFCCLVVLNLYLNILSETCQKYYTPTQNASATL